MNGKIHSIETLAGLDGPGLRCVIFLQGCPLRCAYCHNPDTWDTSSGTTYELPEVIKRILKCQPYFNKNGGVTFSGGEPFAQPEFLLELLKSCKINNIHTAVDTSGYFLDDTVKECLKYTDLVILDIKHNEENAYKKLTGKPLKNTLEFLKYVSQQNILLWLRQVIIPGINDSPEHIKEFAGLIKTYSKPQKVELLPYHTMGIKKWEELKLKYTLMNVKDADIEMVSTLQKLLNNFLQQDRP
ncbi:MAG: pyruvate formate-lyase 1-activating enzyme [Elusimicrobia bacterium RIFOXYA2_FULL_39_19]|nr:MAG: pyruvate formate-lyase 1-activating enzyme [Elusimicrobia bacterium RIFOXYA2_FULL_39_19]